jgi:mRNA interferase MazF
MVKKQYIPERGDLVWLDFEPTKGREQKGVRPAFVVSPKAYNAKVGLALVCPITSHVKGYPFEVSCGRSAIEGVILADHLRSVDWRARNAKFIDAAGVTVVQEVEERLLSLVQS